ncbi:hypothetical protein [Pseudoteredinibacter isoporae]|uniref:hypothetical protein n=1 Tax=Pseudoteredinibacter isoporae TaxID=570281 RepID=UPI003102AD31
MNAFKGFISFIFLLVSLPLFAQPSVVSIDRQTPATSPTNANAVAWRIIFNENVTGVGSADFNLTGPTGASLGVAGSGTTYDVTISGGNLASLNGTVSLSVAPGATINSVSGGQALVDGVPTGTNVNTYLIDNIAPSTLSFNRGVPASEFTDSDSITWLVSFNEDVSGVDLNDFAVTGPTGASIAVTQLTASTYNVQLSGGNLSGLNSAVGLNLNTPSITDIAGNSLPNAEPALDQLYQLQNPLIVAAPAVAVSAGVGKDQPLGLLAMITLLLSLAWFGVMRTR